MSRPCSLFKVLCSIAVDHLLVHLDLCTVTSKADVPTLPNTLITDFEVFITQQLHLWDKSACSVAPGPELYCSSG